MEEIKTKYLIIGGGISGLSFANNVDDYLLVEKNNRLGGYCKTTIKDNFIWDYAGHFFHFKEQKYKDLFLNKIPKEDIIYKEKCTKIYYKGYLIDYPFQTHIHQLPQEEFIDCLYDLFNKQEKKEYNNFLEMLYGKFGKSITEKFLKPYNEKLYACDLQKLDTNAMGRFFPYADKEAIINNMKKSKDNSYNNSFLYPRKGAESFIKVLSDRLKHNKVLLNTTIIKIDKEKHVAYTENIKISYEYLINTSPLNEFLKLFGNNYKELQKALSYNQVLVFNLGFNKKSKFSKEHWIYFPNKDINFYRVGFYDNILDADQLSLYIEIGFDKDYKLDAKEIKKQLDETLRNLHIVGIIDDTFKLMEYETIIMSPAYVHIEEETSNKILDLFKKLEKSNIFSIGRYGGWTYCSMEDCIKEAERVAKTI